MLAVRLLVGFVGAGFTVARPETTTAAGRTFGLLRFVIAERGGLVFPAVAGFALSGPADGGELRRPPELLAKPARVDGDGGA
jgi:hypothetical protein